jgi:hypothetical protein
MAPRTESDQGLFGNRLVIGLATGLKLDSRFAATTESILAAMNARKGLLSDIVGTELSAFHESPNHMAA